MIHNAVNDEGLNETFNRIASTATGGAYDAITAMSVDSGTDDPADGVLAGPDLGPSREVYIAKDMAGARTAIAGPAATRTRQTATSRPTSVPRPETGLWPSPSPHSRTVWM